MSSSSKTTRAEVSAARRARRVWPSQAGLPELASHRYLFTNTTRPLSVYSCHIQILTNQCDALTVKADSIYVLTEPAA